MDSAAEPAIQSLDWVQQMSCFDRCYDKNCRKRRQRGQVVSASDLQSGGPGFESRSGNLLDLFSVVPSSNPRPRL